MTDKGMIKTLDTLLRDNGHSETVIDYLKVNYMSSISQFSISITHAVPRIRQN